MGRLLAGFIEGYGSIIRLFAPPEQDDVENLRRDWIQVGKYLKHSIKELEKEVESRGGESSGEGREKGRAG